MTAGRIATWLLFAAMIAALLIVDLTWGSRPGGRAVGAAGRWTGAVITAAMGFAAIIWLREGSPHAVQFITGYVVELSLSVDNLLVFIVVLQYMAVPAAIQPAVLKWGVVGAMMMRGLVIALGTVLVRHFGWILYVFGALLLFTGARMLVRRDEPARHPGSTPLLRLARRLLPISDRFHEGAFFVRQAGRIVATPLLLVVLVIEWTDLVFATDSIPAIFAITRDPFLVYTSNIFAIIGLRAMFFVLAGMLERFVHLRFGVALVLVLVGMKMLAVRWVTVPTIATLAGVVGVLAISVLASWRGAFGNRAP